MEKHITDVAFDMHQDSVTAAWLLPGATTPEARRFPHEPKTFHRLVRKLLTHGPARACYEAGPWEYAPQRHLAAWGLPCEAIAPALTVPVFIRASDLPSHLPSILLCPTQRRDLTVS